VNAERLEDLVGQVRSLKDPAARDAALELVEAVMDLHRTGLERMIEIVDPAALDEFAKDATVSGILLLHDLHPLDLEVRVRRAVEHPSLADGQARVLAVSDGLVRIRVAGDAGFEARVRNAVLEAAPDAGEIIVESASPPARQAFVPLESLLAR
jgi:hypothetical protein